MIHPPLKALLDRIRLKEAPKGYGQIYGGAKGVPKDTDVSKMTLGGVLDMQGRMLRAGSASTACGGYQFIRKTLAATMAQMGLRGSELWDAELQDRMALQLMQNRGLGKYLAGAMTAEDFCNSLAREWASLPVVSRIKGQRRMVEPGETFYAGDGLNKAHHDPKAIIALVNALIVPPVPKPPQMPVDALGVGKASMAPRPALVQPTVINVFPAPVASRPWWKFWS